MHTNKIILIILLIVICANCSTKDKKSINGQRYKTITTYLQIDTMPKYKYMVETLDSNGKTIERIRYSENNGLIDRIEKSYYDSLCRKSSTTTTWFYDGNLPNTQLSLLSYETNGLISKCILKLNKDTSTIYNEYYPNGKIKSEKRISTDDLLGQNLTKYFYNNNDSLEKIEYWDLKSNKLECWDSIIQNDTSKIVLQYNFPKEIKSKVETIYRNKLPFNETKYECSINDKNVFCKIEETYYTYDGNKLVKKTIRTIDHYRFCGFGDGEQTKTYTYFYE